MNDEEKAYFAQKEGRRDKLQEITDWAFGALSYTSQEGQIKLLKIIKLAQGILAKGYHTPRLTREIK